MKLGGGRVEEGVVYSHEGGTDYAAAGIVGDFAPAAKEVVMQAIDTGTPLGCRDRKKKKKAVYPWPLDAGD